MPLLLLVGFEPNQLIYSARCDGTQTTIISYLWQSRHYGGNVSLMLDFISKHLIYLSNLLIFLMFFCLKTTNAPIQKSFFVKKMFSLEQTTIA